MIVLLIVLLIVVQVALYVALDPFGRIKHRRWERTWRERSDASTQGQEQEG